MDANTVIGTIVLVSSVTTLLFLTFLSRRRIDRIAGKKATTPRRLMKELKNGR